MTISDGPRYEDDFYAWTQYQAEVLRSMPVSDNRFDREHVVEEIEGLGKSECDAVRGQIRRIVEHMLKLPHSPAEQPRLDWIETLIEARQSLSEKLTPTLPARRRGGSGETVYGRPEARGGRAPQAWRTGRRRTVALGMPVVARRHLPRRLVSDGTRSAITSEDRSN